MFRFIYKKISAYYSLFAQFYSSFASVVSDSDEFEADSTLNF